ncbi:MAG: CBS domain-containing protein [Phascolarctobacterium sp.]|nr:CBS domain-containing protein [Phascolarctobacterium sp.]
MLVKAFMTPVVVTVREDQSMLEARETMRGKNLNSLPVVDDLKRVRGIITSEDIGKASPSDASTLSRYEANYLLGRLKVRDIMSRTVITVEADDTIEYVAYKLYKYKVNALPVVDENNKLVGIISQTDIFRAFVEIMAMDRSCTRISFKTGDKVGVVAEVSNLYKDAGINIISIVSRQLEDGSAEVVVRANLSDHGMGVVESIREAGYEITSIDTYEGIE